MRACHRPNKAFNSDASSTQRFGASRRAPVNSALDGFDNAHSARPSNHRGRLFCLFGVQCLGHGPVCISALPSLVRAMSSGCDRLGVSPCMVQVLGLFRVYQPVRWLVRVSRYGMGAPRARRLGPAIRTGLRAARVLCLVVVRRMALLSPKSRCGERGRRGGTVSSISNKSLEPTRTGMALGPRGARSYHPPCMTTSRTKTHCVLGLPFHPKIYT